MSEVFVVAEPGCVHERSVETILRLIQAAADAGCDAFKNQWISKPDEVRRRRRSDYASYDWLCYPLSWHETFRELCHTLDMQYGCSTNLAEDVAAVNPYVDFHKRPSFENNDRGWLTAVKRTGKRFMVSAGMLNHTGLKRLIDEVGQFGEILHCVSAYPSAWDQMQLGVIRQYELDGLSDHSHSLEMGGFAVLAGAGIVEAHLRLEDTSPENPDYAVAWTPDLFRSYVQYIRHAEVVMGDSKKRISEVEQPMVRYKVGA